MKPPGYWSDWTNAEQELRPIIAELGRFPTKPEVEARNSSLAAAIVKFHGGFIALRTRLGYEEGRKPNGHWDKWEHVRAEIERLCQLLGRFPNGNDLRANGLTTLNASIARIHGGMSAVRERLGSEQVRRPNGLYRDWSVVEAELRKIVEETGGFPSAKYCEGHELSSLASAIKRYHGGFRRARERMGCEQARVTNGFYDDWNNLEPELRAVMDELGAFPSQKDLARVGRSSLAAAIDRNFGGFHEVRKRMGVTASKRHPNGHWHSWENVEAALRPLIDRFGHFPSGAEIKASNLSGLLPAMRDHHGGVEAVREKLACPADVKPPGYWKKWENVESVIRELVRELGRFPLEDDFRTRGLSSVSYAIGSYHGGIAAVREKLGVEPSDRHPRGYWTEWTNVERALREIVEETGEFPIESRLRQREGCASLGSAIHTHHGGFAAVRERMGYGTAKRKPRGYWVAWKNVERELTRIIAEIGHYPTGQELTAMGESSLWAALTKWHNGADAVRVRMGYGPVTDELVREHASALARIIPALRVSNTIYFWRVLKTHWVARDLVDALAEFEQAGSLERVEKLLDVRPAREG